MRSELLELVLREMKDGVIIIDMSRKVLYSNPSFQRTFGINGKHENLDISDILDDELLLTVFRSASLSGAPQVYEVTIKKDGGQILDVRLVPFLREGEGGIIGFFHDVTEEKSVEAIKRDFVANVSHELRTPLASIKGYAETLLDGSMEDKSVLKDFLVIIDKHAGRMAALIEDLLDLSILESSNMPLDLDMVEPDSMIAAIVESLEKHAADKGLGLVVEMQDGVPDIRVDRRRVEQVIVNLLDNAIKYTNSGAVRIFAWKEADQLRVDVKDSGIGIPAKDVPRIFERFYRVDKGRSRELGGTGLGLAIVKHIIQWHNGKVWVTSEPDNGSTFSFSLPYRS